VIAASIGTRSTNAVRLCLLACLLATSFMRGAKVDKSGTRQPSACCHASRNSEDAAAAGPDSVSQAFCMPAPASASSGRASV